MLCPSHRDARSSLSLGALPSPRLSRSRLPTSVALGSHPRHLAVPRTFPPSPPETPLRSLQVPTTRPTAGRAAQSGLRRLPRFNRSEAPPPGHLTESDAPPIEPRALGECEAQAAAAARAAISSARGLGAIAELAAASAPHGPDSAAAAPVCPTS